MKKIIILLFVSLMISCDDIPYIPERGTVIEVRRWGNDEYEITVGEKNDVYTHIWNDTTVLKPSYVFFSKRLYSVGDIIVISKK